MRPRLVSNAWHKWGILFSIYTGHYTDNNKSLTTLKWSTSFWTSLCVHKSIIFGKTKECSQIRMSHKKSIHCPKKLKNNTHLQYHPLFYYKRMMKENSRGTQFSGLWNSHFQIFLLIIPHLFLSCKLLQHCNYFSEHWINRLTWVCGFLRLQTQTISI